jgi:predicted Zn-dependent protease
MTMMKFSRNFEREADMLGVEYEYAAGYDPEAFVDFFERLNTDRKKPNFVARAFASHPMNKDRITRTQQEIDTMLPEHEQYIVNTSEFLEIRARLQQLKGATPKLERAPHNPNKPVLHRPEPSGSVPVDSGDSASTDDNRPTLQRRPD